MNRFLLAIAVLGLVPSLAEAAPTADQPGDYHVEHRDIVVEVGPDEAEILSPADAQAAGYYLLYINRCVGGTTVTPGFNDSRRNTSSIPNQSITFPEYPYGDSSWNQVLAEVSSILSPFGVEITDRDPGETPHTEIIACGQSFVGANVLGIAPFGCGLVANAIGYAFAENHGNDPRELAETIAHEAGHTWTLNHLYDCSDPMTYLTGCGDKAFQNTELSCAGVASNGGWQREACSCGGGTQNSYRTLLDFFGPNNDAVPTLQLDAPANNALVGLGFAIRGSASGMNGGELIEIYIDDVLKSRFTDGVIDLNAPEDISEGPHTVKVVVVDQYERRDEIIREVSVSAACACEDSEYCDGEQCLPYGEVGDSCDGDSTCESSLCASAGDTSLCTARCTPGAEDQCANGTTCLETEAGGLCWTSGDDTPAGCGCRSTGTGTASFWGLLLVAFFFRRQRRLQVRNVRS